MEIIFYVFASGMGLIIGSFLNCLIWRLHTGESLDGRSHCPKCGQQINWYDNIPVLSFLLLRGRCRYCRKKISWQYPIVELTTGLLFLIAFARIFPKEAFLSPAYPFHPADFLVLFRDWFLIAVMVIVFIYDLRWYLILDVITLPAAAVLFLTNLGIMVLEGRAWPGLAYLLLSGIIGGSFFLLQFLVSRGRWIGGGDIRLGFLMGLALGWPGIMIALFLAYFLGSFVGLGLIASGKKEWGSKVPLGTFLSVATLAALFWGEQILNWYLNLF